jgi:tripartite-type tricarboxylate transporter receptor subunit TctC
MKSIRNIVLAATLAGAAAVQGPAHAQQYPTRPVTLVVPFTPGGITDNVARLIGKKLSDRLGQPVIVENKPGAGGSLATEHVARAAPDGYTLLVGTQGTHATNLALYKNIKYDPIKDFTAIHTMIGSVNVLLVNPSRPYTTVKELIAYAKQNPRKVNFASAGSGTGTHLTAELFQSLAGIEMVHVPYKGSAPALSDLVAGTVDVMFDYPAATLGHLKAVTYASRLPPLPNVPTIAEAGLPGAESLAWGGIFVPAKTPAAVVGRLVSDMEKVMADPDVTKAVTDLGGVPFSLSGEKFQAFVASEMVKWAEVAKRGNVTAN